MSSKRSQSIIIFSTILMLALCSGLDNPNKRKRKNDYPEQSWKKEYEDELTEAMLSMKPRSGNYSKPSYSKHTERENELVMDKLIDSLTAGEKYLKKIEGIDFKLNRLDIEVHEKTNTILKFLTDISKILRTYNAPKKLEGYMERLMSDISLLKDTAARTTPVGHSNDDATEYGRTEPKTNSRLAAIENSIKSVQEGVENIVSTLSEVKNRQYTRERVRPVETHTSLDTMAIVSEIRRTMHDQRSKKCDCKTGKVDRSERYPTDCNEIQMQGFNVSGIYKIKPDDYESFYVLCDLTTAGGGWTVLQNRMDGSQSFFKTWSDYKYGFGNLAGEFWMGLDKLHFLTTQKLYELRIEMETAQGHEAYAGYSVFSIGPEIEGYRISTLGTYYGTAGDSLSYHAGQKFSTPDLDNDEWKDGSCSMEHGGAWWYKECDKSNLNGNYILDGNEETNRKSIYWISFKGTSSPLAKTRMLIRPLPASRPSETNDVSKKLLETVTGPLHGPNKIQAEKKTSHQHYRYDDTLQNDPYF